MITARLPQFYDFRELPRLFSCQLNDAKKGDGCEIRSVVTDMQRDTETKIG